MWALRFAFLTGCLIEFAFGSDRPCIGQDAKKSPIDEQVWLGQSNGWDAYLVFDNNEIGIWTVQALDLVEQFGSLEIIGLDDKGHAHILTEYSGRWNPRTVVNDGKWLGGLAHGDVDPRIRGKEIYVGSQQGNLYQIVVHENVILDYRLIGQIPGREIHTILANPFETNSLLVFTHPGGIYLFNADGADGKFTLAYEGEHDGRVRQAVLLPCPPGAEPVWATVSRNGRLDLLRWENDRPVWETVYRDQMGLGRIAISPQSKAGHWLLYATLDDGRILQLESQDGTTWESKLIHAGDQGPRGIVVGRFTAEAKDSGRDELAICGYNQRVQLLRQIEGVWSAETIFEDIGKGHWLATAEIDGRNNTEELIVTGYSGRIVLLSRPVGYGLSDQ